MDEQPAPLFQLQHVGPPHPFGQFGALLCRGVPFAVTIERTYEILGTLITKIPAGIYRCVRTTFYHGKPEPYVTFEIVVEGHARTLFHRGNVASDVDGCVAVANSYDDITGPRGTEHGIAASAKGFAELMALAAGRTEVYLEVID